MLRQVLLQGYALAHLGHRRPELALPALRYRYREALKRFVAKRASIKLPAGPLIVLGDGVWFRFKRRPWVLYLTALRSTSGHIAVFLDPVLLPGQEGAFKWEATIQRIPGRIQRRIRAIVVDNLNGMKKLAKRRGWHLQLCHFHLLLKLQVQYRRKRRALIGGAIRETIYRLVRGAIELPAAQAAEATAQLEQIVATGFCTMRLDAVIRDFLWSVPFYRSYLKHPELNLPSTTNVLESMARIVREMLRRNRSGSSPESLLRWVTALIRLRPRMTCNRSPINRNT